MLQVACRRVAGKGFLLQGFMDLLRDGDLVRGAVAVRKRGRGRDQQDCCQHNCKKPLHNIFLRFFLIFIISCAAVK